jgi:hypothetical protein
MSGRSLSEEAREFYELFIASFWVTRPPSAQPITPSEPLPDDEPPFPEPAPEE